MGAFNALQGWSQLLAGFFTGDPGLRQLRGRGLLLGTLKAGFGTGKQDSKYYNRSELVSWSREDH